MPDRIVFEVSPSSDALPVAGVPFLHEPVGEILSAEDGLSMDSEEPFDWSRIGPLAKPFHLVATVDADRFDHAVLTVWNWHNQPVAQQRIAPGEGTPVEIRVGELGVYLVTLDGFRGEACGARLVRSVAVTRDLRPLREEWKQEEFFLGVCAFPGRYHWNHLGRPSLPPGLDEERAREIEADHLARLGFQVVRIDESMEMGPPTESGGEYRFQFERMDAAVAAYTSRGMEVALQLMNAPDWAIDERYAEIGEHRWRYPHADRPHRAYVAALVERYGASSRFVQVFNEPDQVTFWAGTPEEFLDHFESAREETRRVAPAMPIVNGGYSLVDPERTRFFIENLRGRIDFPAYHSHGDLPALREDHETIRRFHEDAGYEAPRFLNTEMGFDGWRLDQERRKGQIVPQKTLYCWSTDHAGVLLFSGRMTFGPKRVTQDFGFLDHHFCPRFVYGSTAALVSTLAGASFERNRIETADLAVHEFRRGEERILVGFTLASDAEIVVRTKDSALQLVDEMGNTAALEGVPGAGGTFRWSLDGYPRYLVFDGEIELEQAVAR